MSNLVELRTFSDNRGDLTVIERQIPFNVKRVFYVYNVDNSKRGFHKHKKTRQFAICLNGSCDIVFKLNKEVISYKLDSPTKGLLIEPEDFHWMENFSNGAVLLVLASEFYDKNDYIYN
jgi:dTDP-4-dehydrorhamnose 3,5-epimerase-like enzyme|tara:strand:+ start:359 stop:715 length:357 start_codon:yes stop_codon:yes gene_type:complete